MPHFIHERAKHILAKNPDMEEGMAFALATQQSHALGKSPKGYGTSEGRKDAKKKYKEPRAMETRANPGRLKTEKLAFVEALPVITGLASGFSPGKNIAGETAAATAPRGRIHRSENIARNAAAVGVPLGGLAAMALAHKYKLAPRLADFAAEHFPKGLISEPDSERELIRQLLPGAAAIGGSLAGGAATGGIVGGLQQLRGPRQHQVKSAALKPSPMWGTIGGQAQKPAWRAQAGFTPPGMATPAQKLQKSMSTGAFNRDKGLKPLDLGKMQKATETAATGVKMGYVMFILTKTALDRKEEQKGEKEDAESGDELFGGENQPMLAKAANDGGHGGFSTNQYSGVMNPPAMKYTSGIPPWQEPPVKTAGPPSSGKEKKAYPYDVSDDPEVQAANAKWDRRALVGGLVGSALGAGAGHALTRLPNKGVPLGRISTPIKGALVGGLGGVMVGGLTTENARQQAIYDAQLRRHEQEGAKTAMGLTPASRLNSASAIGAPRVSAAPGPSIAQIAKPKGYGMPMSGAKKGNNII